jgi:hypothetical protein
MPALLTHLHDPRKIELSVVHDLWPQADHPLLPDFLAAVHTAFGAEVAPLDLRQAHRACARKDDQRSRRQGDQGPHPRTARSHPRSKRPRCWC